MRLSHFYFQAPRRSHNEHNLELTPNIPLIRAESPQEISIGSVTFPLAILPALVVSAS
ncbi:hypothetical protein [Rubritalea tangerina]|uniref:hypothetical protein n=1 Tax=Rubritalea tangerina TaxID=430798 RepID=UPI0036080B64